MRRVLRRVWDHVESLTDDSRRCQSAPLPRSFCPPRSVLDAKVKKTKSRYLWLAQPPGLGIPAGGAGAGRKRRQRDAGDGEDAMETDEGGASPSCLSLRLHAGCAAARAPHIRL